MRHHVMDYIQVHVPSTHTAWAMANDVRPGEQLSMRYS